MKLLHDKTMSLNKLLGCFGMETKSWSGSEAVALAIEKRWEELESYCRQDAVLTHKVAAVIRTEGGRDYLYTLME